MSNKMAPDLGKLDELAKVHALSYASPHHFTMSVNGLREVIAELQLPAGNKIALDALTAAKTQLEILLPDYGRVHDETEALAKIDAAIAALQAEPQGWMPIETAPKDGRSMLLGYPNRAGKWRTVRGQWFSDAEIAETWEEEGAEGWYETSVECEDLPNCWSIEPTHWMPLPATPPKD